MIADSESESRRFGLSVGRAVISNEDEVTELIAEVSLFDFDLVIVRYPPIMLRLFERLADIVGVAPIFADTILYYEWLVTQSQARQHGGLQLGSLSAQERESAILDIFSQYPNHYRANSLLPTEAVAAGYAEWATSLCDGPTSFEASLLCDGRAAALAIVDTQDEWDVALAGVAQAFRGRGLYRSLIESLMSLAADAGQNKLRISTQTHNVPVIRVWEQLGWRLVGAQNTVHLTRG